MATADINGTTLHYTQVGEGPICLVMHGGLGYDQTPYRTLDPLAEHLHLVYYDHRGNGRSGRPPIETLTMAQLADDAAALADHLGAERFLVLGHSFGGFVAQELAYPPWQPAHRAHLVGHHPRPTRRGRATRPRGTTHPSRVRRAAGQLPHHRRGVRGGLPRAAPRLLHSVDAAAVEPLLEGTIFDAAAMVRGFEILNQWSSVDRLFQVTVPVFLGVGRHDAFTSFPQSYRIAGRLADAEVVVYEDSGHFPWWRSRATCSPPSTPGSPSTTSPSAVRPGDRKRRPEAQTCSADLKRNLSSRCSRRPNPGSVASLVRLSPVTAPTHLRRVSPQTWPARRWRGGPPTGLPVVAFPAPLAALAGGPGRRPLG